MGVWVLILLSVSVSPQLLCASKGRDGFVSWTNEQYSIDGSGETRSMGFTMAGWANVGFGFKLKIL